MAVNGVSSKLSFLGVDTECTQKVVSGARWDSHCSLNTLMDLEMSREGGPLPENPFSSPGK